MGKTRVILVTDGDRVAQEVVSEVGKKLGLRTISASGGNPTPRNGEEIVELIKQAKYDPVLVMVDDRGKRGKYKGEQALEYIATHPDIEVLGAVAVASNTSGVEGAYADEAITKDGQIVHQPVDKYGELKSIDVELANNDLENKDFRIKGDTVDVLNRLNIPVVVGIGDIGKMDKADDISKGAPITTKAIEEILKYHGIEMKRFK